MRLMRTYKALTDEYGDNYYDHYYDEIYYDDYDNDYYNDYYIDNYYDEEESPFTFIRLLGVGISKEYVAAQVAKWVARKVIEYVGKTLTIKNLLDPKKGMFKRAVYIMLAKTFNPASSKITPQIEEKIKALSDQEKISRFSARYKASITEYAQNEAQKYVDKTLSFTIKSLLPGYGEIELLGKIKVLVEGEELKHVINGAIARKLSEIILLLTDK